MSGNAAVRVGIIVVVAMLAFVGVYFFLTNFLSIGSYELTTVFPDAQGLTNGSTVSMAGVTVGSVDRISLDSQQRAIVVLKISNKYKDKIPTGSHFILRVGLLVGEKQIDIVPNRGAKSFIQPGKIVEGEEPPRIEDLIPAGKKLMASLSQTSQNLSNLLGDKELKNRLYRTMDNIEDASAKMDKTITMVQKATEGEQDSIKKITENMAAASTDVTAVTHELARFAKEGQLQSNMKEILAATRRMVDSMDRTTSSLEKLVTNPEFQSDIRQTVSQTRQTVENANQALSRVNEIIGGKHGGKKGLGLPSAHASMQGLYRGDDSRVRIDALTTLKFGSGKFLDLGIYDLGVRNKGILQPGFPISSRADFRYGIYASRLGVGFDYDFSSKTYGKLDLYDSVSPRLDILTGYRLGGDVDVLLGMDKVFRENQITAGVRLSR